jgi:hypothetical protein
VAGPIQNLASPPMSGAPDTSARHEATYNARLRPFTGTPPLSALVVDDREMKLGKDSFILPDATGHAFAYVHCKDESGSHHAAAHLLVLDEARRIAASKLPQLLQIHADLINCAAALGPFLESAELRTSLNPKILQRLAGERRSPTRGDM